MFFRLAGTGIKHTEQEQVGGDKFGVYAVTPVAGNSKVY